MLTALVLIAGGCTDPGYEVVVELEPPELADEAVVIEVALVEDCAAQPRGQPPVAPRAHVSVTRGDSPSLGQVDSGPAGLYALARAADCRVVASGCEPVELDEGGSGRLVVTATSVAAGSCPPGSTCNGAGECTPGADAGPDAGEDASMPDGGVDDARVPDAAVDAGPDADVPVVPPPPPSGCWWSTEACDWSEPTGFRFVPSSTDTLDALTMTGNPSFSPDGCELYFGNEGELHVARRASARGAFAGLGTIPGVEDPETSESKASVSPDGLELYFSSNRLHDGWHSTHRAVRDEVGRTWMDIVEVPALSFDGIDNWDGSLAPHGLRFYWAPDRVEGRYLYVSERDSLDAAFGSGVLVEELAEAGDLYEPTVTADGRVIVVVAEPATSTGQHVMYATRSSWRDPFGSLMEVPGAFLSSGTETETAVSADGCELVVSRDGTFTHLVYEAL